MKIFTGMGGGGGKRKGGEEEEEEEEGRREGGRGVLTSLSEIMPNGTDDKK